MKRYITPLNVRLNKLSVRLFTALKILISPNSHWFMVVLSRDNMVKCLTDNAFETDVVTHGMQAYNVKYAILHMASGIDPDEYALDKAEFEAKSELILERLK